MTLEERVAAVERELQHQNDLRALREINENLAAARAVQIDAELGTIKKKVLPNLQAAMKELEEANIVTAGQTGRHETRIQEHQRWQEQMELSFARMASNLEALDERMAAFDERIAEIAKADAKRGAALHERIHELVSAIGELIRARNGKQQG